jgi:hypothetical protein
MGRPKKEKRLMLGGAKPCAFEHPWPPGCDTTVERDLNGPVSCEETLQQTLTAEYRHATVRQQE